MRPMKSMFHQSHKSVPSLNVASMPDLIFTVLFFFMIVTHMRQTEMKVRYVVPQGTELEKTGHKGSVVYLYIGHPVDEEGNEKWIQIVVKVPTGGRDEEGFDGYGVAESYQLKLKEKEEKRKENEEKKRKKIEKDKKMREKKKEKGE